MTVGELIVELQKHAPDTRVCFDTEAQHFDVHLVPVDSVSFIEDFGNGDVVTLHEDGPHRGRAFCLGILR